MSKHCSTVQRGYTSPQFMSFTICRAHMVHYFLNGTVCLRSRGCAGRDEPSAPLYLITPYFYCCCHGDIHLSAEASASTSLTIWLVDSVLTGSGWVVSMPTEVLGGQFRLVDGQLIQEQLRMRLRCSELLRQLQVLIDRCDYEFW